jgi:probable rRNA maturation factor
MTTILLQIEADLAGSNPIHRDQLEQAARTVLQLQNVTGDAMLSIIITTDEHIRQLNQQFRGIDSPTDVLSFPADPLPEEVEAEEGRYWGDVIIGLPYTLRRVQAAGHNIHDELMLLVIHGTLHLLGFDHDTPENQTVMWKHQAEALAAMQITLDVPDYIHED